MAASVGDFSAVYVLGTSPLLHVSAAGLQYGTSLDVLGDPRRRLKVIQHLANTAVTVFRVVMSAETSGQFQHSTHHIPGSKPVRTPQQSSSALCLH